MSTQEHDTVYGWQPAIPEPLWVRRGRPWKRRWVPACFPCRMEFHDEAAYGAHWLRLHARAADEGGQ